MSDQKNNTPDKKVTRRDVIKGFSTLPVLGVFAYDQWKKNALEKVKNKALNFDLGLSSDSPQIVSNRSKPEGFHKRVTPYEKKKYLSRQHSFHRGLTPYKTNKISKDPYETMGPQSPQIVSKQCKPEGFHKGLTTDEKNKCNSRHHSFHKGVNPL